MTCGVREYFATAREREAIRLRRAAGLPYPWTTDAALRDWRFCNVHREHDKTTMWFREHVRSKLNGLAVAEATVIFRWFNLISTGEIVKDLLLRGWDSGEALRRLTGEDRVFTGAYRISHHSRGKLFTGAYIIKSPDGKSKLRGILECIDEARRRLPEMVDRWKLAPSLQSAWNDLRGLPFLGGFMAYEVVSDLRWTSLLAPAPDMMTWANAGPGCARGIGYVTAGDSDRYSPGSAKGQAAMLEVMRELLSCSRESRYWPQDWRPWEMREVEHWACEYAKYVQAREGKQLKRRYAPSFLDEKEKEAVPCT